MDEFWDQKRLSHTRMTCLKLLWDFPLEYPTFQVYNLLLSVRHFGRCSIYIDMYIYSSMPWILESLNLNIDEGLSKALHFEIGVWYIFPKKQQVENRPLKHQTPNLESIMFEFPYVKFWVNFKFGVFSTFTWVNLIFFSPNLKDPFESERNHMDFTIVTPISPHLTVVWIDQIRVVATSLGDLWKAVQRAQLWQAIQCSKFGSTRHYRLCLLQSFSHPAIRGQANPDYMNTSQPLIAKFRNPKCNFVKFGGP